MSVRDRLRTWNGLRPLPVDRSAWEQLDPLVRRRIYQAVKSGEALADPSEAELVVELARRHRRLLLPGRWSMWGFRVLVMGWIVWLGISLATGAATPQIVSLAAAATLGVAVLLILARYRSRIARAEARNQRVAGH